MPVSGNVQAAATGNPRRPGNVPDPAAVMLSSMSPTGY